MRKKLVALTLMLTAAAVATTSAAAATKCPRNTYPVVCSSTLTVCCPNGAACLCPPPES